MFSQTNESRRTWCSLVFTYLLAMSMILLLAFFVGATVSLSDSHASPTSITSITRHDTMLLRLVRPELPTMQPRTASPM